MQRVAFSFVAISSSISSQFLHFSVSCPSLTLLLIILAWARLNVYCFAPSLLFISISLLLSLYLSNVFVSISIFLSPSILFRLCRSLHGRSLSRSLGLSMSHLLLPKPELTFVQVRGAASHPQPALGPKRHRPTPWLYHAVKRRKRKRSVSAQRQL